MTSLVQSTQQGLYCHAGDFYVDPCSAVERAVITHAHADHARPGSTFYLSSQPGESLLRERLGAAANIESLPYGESNSLHGVRVSLHPAGHILGSAQVRIEHRGEVCVVSGDYKTVPDRTCTPLEVLRCNSFISESTFALPIYRWPAESLVFEDIHRWWRLNQDRNRTSIIFAYSLGKSQRLLAGLDASVGPILVHGAVARYLQHYVNAGVSLPSLEKATDVNARAHRGRALVLAPPLARGNAWLNKFGETATAMASGWMRIRGMRRRRTLDAGFVLSDHADWEGTLSVIHATGAQEILATHGYSAILAHWLGEQGLQATTIETAYEGELEESERTMEIADDGSGVPSDRDPA